jgi:hypothetical protein
MVRQGHTDGGASESGQKASSGVSRPLSVAAATARMADTIGDETLSENKVRIRPPIRRVLRARQCA